MKYKKELRREKVLMLGEGAVLFIGSLGQRGWWGQFWDFLFFSLFNFITFQFIKTIFFSCNVTSRIPWLWNMMGGCDAGILAGKLQWRLKQTQWAHPYNLIYNWTDMRVQRTRIKQVCAPLTIQRSSLGHPKSMQCNLNSCSFNYKSCI